MSTDQIDIDILLYVALIEEFDALNEALTSDLNTNLDVIELVDLALQIFSVNVPSSALRRDFRLGIVPAGIMGITRAASVVSAVIDRSRCNDVVVLGIAGSLSNDLQPGDVFIPGIVTEYLANSAAINDPETGQCIFQTSGNPHLTTPRLLDRFQLFKSTSKDHFENWMADCASRSDLVATKEIQTKMASAGFAMRSEIKLFVGDNKKLASGPTVGKSEAFINFLKSVDRKFVAIDMETAGVYDATTIRSIPPRMLAIRGISDFADERKTLIEDGTKGQFRVIAVKNALSLLLRGIEAGFFEPESSLKKSATTRAEADKWARIRLSSNEWIDQIHTTLPNGFELPRADETTALRKAYSEGAGAHVLGESGFGKSALLKQLATKAVESGSEVVWIKAEHFSDLHQKIPELAGVLLKTERASGLLVIDSIENCYPSEQLDSIGRFMAAVVEAEGGIWKVFLSCQTPSWPRVSSHLWRSLAGHDVLTERIECKRLSDSDFRVVLDAASTIKKLTYTPRLRRFLRSPKMLDMLLRNRPDPDRLYINEADIVDWWWEDQVKSGKSFSGEEVIARELAIHLADSLTSEASPDVVKHNHKATNSLIERQILSRTNDGRIRFDHDLLADWARVMHLRSIDPDEVLTFIRKHSENPPWLQAIRIFSQHLLERASEHERWQSIVDACRIVPPARKEPGPHDLQILDTWLEGIIYCSDPDTLLKQNREQLFAENAWLLKRLLHRMLHNATIPDPVVQKQVHTIDPTTADYMALHYRLPVVSLWLPLISFLIKNPNEATDYLPVLLAKLGLIWGRLEEYLEINWEPLAELLLLNAEKELRREVAGACHHGYSAGNLGGETNSRVTIYSAALKAASQNPDCASNLALKAAGRKEWSEGDLTDRADEGWQGKRYERSFFGGHGSRVIDPVEAWPDGPRRSISCDFYQAWFKTNASLPLFAKRPAEACEVTLAFLLDWPKTVFRKGSPDIIADLNGFRFEADWLKSAFWLTGPFIGYLRSNWRPAVELVIRLTNFATDRYEEWWSYSPAVESVTIKTSNGESKWKGNHQVFAWNRYHMNTHQVVTCALMALEKWFYERIEAGESVSDAINLLFHDGRSLALAGVLVCVGKRHESLFTKDLKPLLFARAIYNLDLTSILQNCYIVAWPFEDKFILNAKREWENRPGRNTWLKKACLNWMLTKPEFKTVFEDVSCSLRKDAEEFPEDSTEHKTLMHFAFEINPVLWTRRQLEGGQVEFFNETLGKFHDIEEEKDNNLRQALLRIPIQCAKLLEKRPKLEDSDFSYFLDQLQDPEISNRAKKLANQEPGEAEFLDPRHARASMIAVLICLGEEWVNHDPGRFDYLDRETRTILHNHPDIKASTPEDTRDDFEGFLARIVVRRWATNPDDAEWRDAAGSFVTSYRYQTVRQLFDEAFRCRGRLGTAYGELEALALAFSAVRQEAKKTGFGGAREVETDLITTWVQEWLPKFARGEGPEWTDDWASIEFDEVPQRLEQDGPSKPLTLWYKLSAWAKSVPLRVRIGEPVDIESPSEHDASDLMEVLMRRELHRTRYGLDMDVILASFGHLPRLSESSTSSEREHWITICREMLAAFLRTLPLTEGSDRAEWNHRIWSADKNIFEIVAARLFDCSISEGHDFWKRILSLPPAAHRHIEQFLDAVLLEALRTDPPNVERLIKIWTSFADHLGTQETWTKGKCGDADEVWRIILFFGTHSKSTSKDVFTPLVRRLTEHYRNYVTRIKCDSYSQRVFAEFLTTEAADPIFINALEWLHDSWKEMESYSLKLVINHEFFERLLRVGWNNRFEEIRQNTKALSAFKTLTLNLAVSGSTVAMEIQNRISGSDTK